MSQIRLYDDGYKERLVESADIGSQVLTTLLNSAHPGVTTWELEQLAEYEIARFGAKPAFKGFEGYPFCTCLSVNEVIVHGTPTNRKLALGDVISIDVGVVYKGVCADNARTIVVGGVPSDHDELIRLGRRAFEGGLRQAYPGKKIGDISYAIAQEIYRSKSESGNKFKFFYGFQGHGIGLELHELPNVPNMGFPGTGPEIRPGMCLCLEPVILYRTSDPVIRPTVTPGASEFIAADGLPSSHFENQIFVTEDGPIVLTKCTIG